MLGRRAAIDLAPRHLDYIQKNISENIANRLSVHSRGEKYALDVHRRRGRGSGGIDRRGPGGHPARRVVLCRGHRILEEFRTLHREGERRRQGRDQDQLYRRPARGAAVRGRQCGAHARGRHRQRDRRVLHQPDAGGGRLQAQRQADERAAPERHLGVHQPAAQPEAQFATIWRASSTTFRSTSISTRRSTRSTSPA